MTDIHTLPSEDQAALNVYMHKDEGGKVRATCYALNGISSLELEASCFWLGKALAHVRQHPEVFDEYMAASLELLISFLTTGDEQAFKEHSIAWLRSKNRVGYVFGFIETYDDPLGYRATFQADITIKHMEMKHLEKLIPQLELQLPFPVAFKRINNESVLNASLEVKAGAFGALGPLDLTLAYCLPNDEHIRATYGSKQVIYVPEKGIGALLNPTIYRKLFYTQEQRSFMKAYDPAGELEKEIDGLLTLLHETIGHGSGRLAQHTATQDFIFEDKEYKIGQTVDVTPELLRFLLCGTEQTLEELRAEILALYVAVVHYDEIVAAGLLGDWPSQVDQSAMIDQLIISMASSGIWRLLSQQEQAQEMAGDHARANYVIMNFMLDRGGIALVEERVTHEDKEHVVLGIQVIDQQRALESIKDLMVHVQTIKSTADAAGARTLLETYGIRIRHPEHITYMKQAMNVVAGNVKVSAQLYPLYRPIMDASASTILDIEATWPTSMVELQTHYKKLCYEWEA